MTRHHGPTTPVVVKVLEARHLRSADWFSKSDPYVEIRIKDSAEHFKTRRIDNCLNPVWNEQFTLNSKKPTESVLLKVYDHNSVTINELLGEVEIPICEFANQPPTALWRKLMIRTGHKLKPAQGEILVTLQYGNVASTTTVTTVVHSPPPINAACHGYGAPVQGYAAPQGYIAPVPVAMAPGGPVSTTTTSYAYGAPPGYGAPAPVPVAVTAATGYPGIQRGNQYPLQQVGQFPPQSGQYPGQVAQPQYTPGYAPQPAAGYGAPQVGGYQPHQVAQPQVSGQYSPPQQGGTYQPQQLSQSNVGQYSPPQQSGQYPGQVAVKSPVANSSVGQYPPQQPQGGQYAPQYHQSPPPPYNPQQYSQGRQIPPSGLGKPSEGGSFGVVPPSAPGIGDGYHAPPPANTPSGLYPTIK